MTPALWRLGAGALWLACATAAAAAHGPPSAAEAAPGPARPDVRIQLLDGSVLLVPTGESPAANAPATAWPGGSAELAAPGATPHLLMRRRGQIFDPATPGVVAAIRG